MIRPAAADDAGAISAIYSYYVLNTAVSFEEVAPSATTMAERMAQSLEWIVAVEQNSIVGFACAVPWKARSAYRHSAEISVYLREGCQSRGWGRLLYESLILRLSARGIHQVMGGVALPNAASVRLHESLGFKKVAHFERVGQKFGQWWDVAYWQKSIADR
ncbi:MAG: N-acetyltransferase family protein [Bdellovibrionales bacterium]